MRTVGLDIQGLDLTQISRKMEEYLANYFDKCVVIADGNGIFAEVIRLAYDEVEHLIIQPEGVQLFNDGDWFNGASGFFELSSLEDGSKEELTAMLVLDEPQTRALFLYVSKWDATTGNDINILIQDFTQDGVS